MTWFVYVDGRRSTIAPGMTYTVGRDEATCDIPAPGSHRVSRRHLTVRLDEAEKTWTVADVSANGTASPMGFWLEGSGRCDIMRFDDDSLRAAIDAVRKGEKEGKE